MSVREAQSGDVRAVAHTLALAFEDDPVMAFLFPRDAGRRRRLERFYRLTIPSLARHGVVHTRDGIHAAAVWQAPSPPRPDPSQGPWLALRMLLALRTALPRALTLNETIRPAHLREPHWYLAMLGTEPAHQGRGLASALLAPTLDRCDREGAPAYLESSKAQNIPFYERHGFEVVTELCLPDGPSLWTMLRRPRPARGSTPQRD